nr:MAG: replication associated protein [Cressdnaviricota sp.]
MDEKAHIGTIKLGEEGNEVSSSPNPKLKQATRRKFYCSAIFNYIGIETTIIDYLKSISVKGIIGYETCPSTNNSHLQVFIALKKAMRMTEIKLPIPVMWQACKGDENANIKYCSKDGNYIKWGFPEPIKIITNLRAWQLQIENICLLPPDDRSVYWYWEDTGNFGKSAFCKYMVVKHNALFCSGGKHSDIINLVFNQDMDNCKIIIFDIPRAHKGAVSYSALESIKNGMICNTKYETGVKIFNPPHIIIFANFAPDKPEMLSLDRWNINNLIEELC